METDVKKLYLTCLILGLCLAPVIAHAYTTKCSGTSCDVKCKDGTFVGTMYWNGSQWSDGVRADKDKNKVAKAMVAAQGTSCQ